MNGRHLALIKSVFPRTIELWVTRAARIRWQAEGVVAAAQIDRMQKTRAPRLGTLEACDAVRLAGGHELPSTSTPYEPPAAMVVALDLLQSATSATPPYSEGLQEQ